MQAERQKVDVEAGEVFCRDNVYDGQTVAESEHAVELHPL